jgi:imidazolonepropionase
MIDLVVANASQILTCCAPGETPPFGGKNQASIGLAEGGVAIDDGRIVEVGPGAAKLQARETLDAGGGVVLPGFVDCHTHPVFAGARAAEFEERAKGVSYEELAKRGGGIRASMKQLREASDDVLHAAVRRHLDGFLAFGTTTIEAKSGYGLSLEDERRSLRALAQDHPVEVVRTCLAAHAVPPEFDGRREAYVDLVVDQILPAVAEEGLAEYCDVFCELGVFSFDESERILRAGASLGLRPRIHADQRSRSGGARIACRVGAITADHLEYATREDARALKEAGVIAVLLPAANHFLDQEQRPVARAMVNVGLPVALATDFNPGTAPTQSMPLVLNLAVVRYKLTVAEAIVGATINAACAAGVQGRVGSLEPGKRADLVVCDVADYRELAYWFGGNPVTAVVKKGQVVRRR